MLDKKLEYMLDALKNEAQKTRYQLTLEHLLLALLDNPDVINALEKYEANASRLRSNLLNHINHLTPVEQDEKIEPTPEFQRVIQRAIFVVQSAGKREVFCIDVLAALFSEQASKSVFFLLHENIHWQEINDYILNTIERSDVQNQKNNADHYSLTTETDEPKEQDEDRNSPLTLYTTNLNNRTKMGLIDRRIQKPSATR